jgi:ribosomal protein S18 acetylase RimI-like enzyme
VDEVIGDIEAALVAHWSHLGRWTRGALVEEAGVLRFETPIPHLPYNGVIRTRVEGEDPERVIAAVRDSFDQRGVPFLWWDHPSCSPVDLGRRLAAQGLAAVENVSGMSLELDGWRAVSRRPGVRYEEVVDEEAMQVYEDLIVSYWELPEESQTLVADLNRFWGPGRLPAHRWLAYVGDRPVGKVLLSLAGPPGVGAVYGMSVRPEARGSGIASDMTAMVLERARELGCRRVVLHSSEMAVEVYRRIGFVEHSKLTVYANAPLWSSRHR